MNKTLLIIICDFLLISLLAVARFDKLEPEEPTTQADPVAEADPESDLLEVLQQSLEEERLAREQMDQLLSQAKTELETRNAQLAQSESQKAQTEAELRRKEQEAREEAAARAALAQQLANSESKLSTLERDFTTTKANLTALERQAAITKANLEAAERQKAATEQRLAQIRAEAQASQSEIEAMQNKLAQAQSESRVNQQLVQSMQEDLAQKVQLTAAMEKQITSLDQQREQAVLQSQKLSGQLQVVQTESRFTRQQLDSAQQEISAVRQEKETIQKEKETIQKQTTQLAQGVTQLATTSDKLTQEIRESRPLSPNNIFQEFTSNRVHSSFQGTRKGFFGQSVREDKVANTILFTIGDKSYALYHISETPLELSPSPTDWDALNATFRRNTAFSPMSQVFFLDRDPRILISPVTGDQAAKLGVKSYALSKDILKFEEAVLVGATDNYYGECRFRIDPDIPGYMLMEREILGRIFGKFSPSKGDLVFSKQGELIGMMANNKYCMIFDNLTSARRLRLGSGLDGQFLPNLLSQMYHQIMNMPFRLQ